MTLVVAISFFNTTEKDMGYILASDAKTGIVEFEGLENFEDRLDPTKERTAFTTEKSVSGSNYIGLFSGTILLPSDQHSSIFKKKLDSWRGFFESIEDGKNYDRVIDGKGGPDTSLLIAKRENASVGLYQIKYEGSNWIARKLHSASNQTYKREKSKSWHGTWSDGSLVRSDLELKVDPMRAQEFAIELLKGEFGKQRLGRQVEEVFVYYIDSNHQGRIDLENGILIPYS